MNFDTIHQKLGHGTSLLCRPAGCQINWQLDILASLGHWEAENKINLFFRKKFSSFEDESHISVHVDAFWIGNDAVKSFTTIFICIQIAPIFSNEIQKLRFHHLHYAAWKQWRSTSIWFWTLFLNSWTFDLFEYIIFELLNSCFIELYMFK